jgi:predicted PP-loop superfamily ATPase
VKRNGTKNLANSPTRFFCGACHKKIRSAYRKPDSEIEFVSFGLLLYFALNIKTP